MHKRRRPNLCALLYLGDQGRQHFFQGFELDRTGIFLQRGRLEQRTSFLLCVKFLEGFQRWQDEGQTGGRGPEAVEGRVCIVHAYSDRSISQLEEIIQTLTHPCRLS